MTPRDIKSEDLYIYNLESGLKDNLELLYFDSSLTAVPAVATATNSPPQSLSPSESHQGNSCNVCNLDLAQEGRSHYKTDLHKYNLKRSFNELPPLSEDEFDKLLEEKSIESLSGSDEESEGEDEENDTSKKLDIIMEQLNIDQRGDSYSEDTVSHLNTKSPFIYCKSPLLDANSIFAIYKCLFTNNQLQNEPLETFKTFQNMKNDKSALFMIGGGHFAGAIISHTPKNTKGNAYNPKISKQEQAVNIIVSKTFHRYTTRRKQGGSQSASDNSGRKAVSAGSSIRRYNEQALIQDIRELLESWRSHLNDCKFVFIRANGPANRKILVGYEGSPLASDDSRLRSFPFTTKRATASELKRAWVELFYLKIMKMPKEDMRQKKFLEQQKQQLLQSQAPEKTVEKIEKSKDEIHSIELVNLLKKSKAPLLINYIKKNNLSPDFELQPTKQYIHNPTLLHYASAHGLQHMVQVLLINLKANPTVKNISNKNPAELAANPPTRKAFQIARYKLGEDYCNWQDAKVGVAKSKEEFDKEDKINEEKIKQEKKQLIQQELSKKTDMELKKPSFSSSGKLGTSLQTELSGLSNEQKMRLMREQRARAALARMGK